MKVKLYFREIRDTKLSEKIKDYDILRLIALITFKKGNDWSKVQRGIVDTGAPTSLIPFSIWNEVDTKIITSHEISGINSKKDCKIDVKVGKVKCKIIDENENETKELEIFSLLALTDEIPLIIGFKNLLDKFKVCFDYENKVAFVENQNEAIL